MPQPKPDAVQQAVRLLARREHSSRELRDKLRARDYSDAAVDAALAALRRSDLQSDWRFAQACSRSLMDRGYGSLRVANELRTRGVSDAITQEFEQLARQDEQQRAGDALRKRMRSGAMQKTQMLRFLNRRGYPGAVAGVAADAALRGESE